jgi:hypothetical protein
VDLETINTKVLELYPAAAVGNNFEAMVQFLQIDRDAIWLCPALHIAQLMSASVRATNLTTRRPSHALSAPSVLYRVRG